MIARSALVAATVIGWSLVRPSPAPADDTPRDAKAVTVAPAVLDAYAGRYELAPKVFLTLRRHREHLLAQISGQPPFEVYPESETRFFWKIVPAKFAIQKDDAGKVTGLLFEQGGAKLKGKRVEAAPPPGEPEEVIDSPRLAALAKAVKAGDSAAVGTFWAELRDKAPLIEPVAKDARNSWVSYIWKGTDATRRVTLNGGMPSSEEQRPLARLPGTDLWYLTEKVPNDARLTYSFHVNGPAKVPGDLLGQLKLMDRSPPLPDPENPRLFWVRSVVELPAAPKQPWADRRSGVARGTLTEHKVKSELLKQERSFAVYTPPGYDAKSSEPCGLLVLFDGPDYRDAEMIPGPDILDNLIADKKVPPLVTVFVKHANRMKELACSEPFADYLAKELVPWVRENYRVSADPNRTIVGGLSLGGLMASFCGLRHPAVFGNVLSQSGSYQWSPGLLEVWQAGTPSDIEPGELTRRFLDAPRVAVRFYLEAGRFEDGIGSSLVAENRRFRDVLRAKGYSVKYAEFAGGHAHLNWRGTLADGLIALTAPPDRK